MYELIMVVLLALLLRFFFQMLRCPRCKTLRSIFSQMRYIPEGNKQEMYCNVCHHSWKRSALLGRPGGGGGGFPSDIRLKENIKPLGKVNGINVYSWDWNKKGIELGLDKYPTVGVIAQEIVKTRPDAVWLENGYFMVDYSKALAPVAGRPITNQDAPSQ